MQVLTTKQMTDKLQVSRETFRKTWKRFPHIFVGEGTDLRSARFLWDDATILEVAHGGIEVQDKKGNPVPSRSMGGRRKGSNKSRISNQARSSPMGEGYSKTDLSIHAQRLGII